MTTIFVPKGTEPEDSDKAFWGEDYDEEEPSFLDAVAEACRAFEKFMGAKPVEKSKVKVTFTKGPGRYYERSE